MKKVFLFGVAVLLSLTLGLTVANAQCPTPGPNDYPNIPFIPGNPNPITIQTPMGSGCTMTFSWCWRTTPFNGGEVEIYIGAISRSAGCTGTFDINNLIRIASREVIVNQHPWTTQNGGAGFTINTPVPPCPELSSTIYRILNASCYSDQFFDPNTGNWVRNPCGNGNNGRCEEAWRVCREQLPDGTWHLNETLVSVVNNGATCPATTNNASGQPIPCTRICD